MYRIVLVGLTMAAASMVACSKRGTNSAALSTFRADGALVGVRSDDSRFSLLAFEKTFVLVGFNQVPHTLGVSPEFDLNAVPSSMKENLLQVKFVKFVPPIYGYTGLDYHGDFLCRLKEFRSVTTVEFEVANIADWQCLGDVPVQCVIVDRQEIPRKSDLVNVLGQINTLKYLVHDRVFSKKEINMIQQRMPQIIVLEKSQYARMVKDGEVIP